MTGKVKTHIDEGYMAVLGGTRMSSPIIRVVCALTLVAGAVVGTATSQQRSGSEAADGNTQGDACGLAQARAEYAARQSCERYNVGSCRCRRTGDEDWTCTAPWSCSDAFLTHGSPGEIRVFGASLSATKAQGLRRAAADRWPADVVRQPQAPHPTAGSSSATASAGSLMRSYPAGRPTVRRGAPCFPKG